MSIKTIGIYVLVAVVGAVAFRKVSFLSGLLDKVGL